MRKPKSNKRHLANEDKYVMASATSAQFPKLLAESLFSYTAWMGRHRIFQVEGKYMVPVYIFARFPNARFENFIRMPDRMPSKSKQNKALPPMT